MKKITNTPARFWGERLMAFDSLPSTNDYAREMATKGEGNGTVILAREQVKGRGRLDRTWHSPSGGLWFSLILRPPVQVEWLAGTTLLFSLWVMQFLEKETQLPFQLLWPNDIYREGRKVGGILIESTSRGKDVEWIVAGIGLNINNEMAGFSPERQTTSLREETGKTFSLEPFLRDLLAFMENQFARFLKKGFSVFIDAAAEHCPMAGRKIQVIDHRGARVVKVLGIGEHGQLAVVTEEGFKEDLWSVERVTLL
jgi:BirA family transcriptional regulator, biotin operon repressor / biotin---[acetyl-CoA-carboxylase] ligase